MNMNEISKIEENNQFENKLRRIIGNDEIKIKNLRKLNKNFSCKYVLYLSCMYLNP